jgi:hypothetical protein
MHEHPLLTSSGSTALDTGASGQAQEESLDGADTPAREPVPSDTIAAMCHATEASSSEQVSTLLEGEPIAASPRAASFEAETSFDVGGSVDRAGHRWRPVMERARPRWAKPRAAASMDLPWARMDALQHVRSYDAKGASLGSHRPGRSAAYLAHVALRSTGLAEEMQPQAHAARSPAAAATTETAAGGIKAASEGATRQTPSLPRSTSCSGPIRAALLAAASAPMSGASRQYGSSISSSASVLGRSHRNAPVRVPPPHEILL